MAAHGTSRLSRHYRLDGRVGSGLAALEDLDHLVQELRDSFGWFLIAHDHMEPGRAHASTPGLTTSLHYAFVVVGSCVGTGAGFGVGD
jgi:hypothetical protein